MKIIGIEQTNEKKLFFITVQITTTLIKIIKVISVLTQL